MDLDGLKKINDVHGHLAGSRALCRLASILRLHSRGIDMAARYGGDEFALIIPEAGADVAPQVALRISERLASDGQHPALSASVGAAVCPEDGETIEMLMRSADRALYAMKRRAHSESILVATGLRSAS
jgi:diguanylate cyclase (GGDEF)-like protein